MGARCLWGGMPIPDLGLPLALGVRCVRRGGRPWPPGVAPGAASVAGGQGGPPVRRERWPARSCSGRILAADAAVPHPVARAPSPAFGRQGSAATANRKPRSGGLPQEKGVQAYLRDSCKVFLN